ncbi:MAG: S41 family peptidase [Oscillospiraceae bacterium]
MKKFKRVIAMILVVFCVSLPFGNITFATEPLPLEERTPEQTNEYIKMLVEHLAIYSRYEKVNEGSLYKAALEGIMLENPELFETAMKAMLKSVDENSAYFTEEESMSFQTGLDGEIIGIGISINEIDGDFVIGSFLENSPAKTAGLMVGDVIVSVDDADVKGTQLNNLTSRIRGEIGTEVTVGVMRENAEEELKFSVIREKITTKMIDYKIYGENENRVMYIGFGTFTNGISEEFSKVLDIADNEGITNILIDLRNNGGGILSEAIAIAENFVPSDNVITTEDHKIDMFDITYKSKNTRNKKYDTAVLINGNSASASEVLAAALSENEVGILIGEQSYGKGTVQKVVGLDNNASMKYTMAYYLTPNGNNINKVGLAPYAIVKNDSVPIDASGF